MSQKVTINYCGMPGTGDTVTKAKQDATRRIEAVLSGDWTPYLLSHKDWRAVVVRTPGPEPLQWGYKIFQSSDGSQDLYVAGNWETRDAAIKKAAHHLAQCVGNYEALERWLSPADQRDLDRYFAWQAEYAVAKAQGLTDQECRDRADAMLCRR